MKPEQTESLNQNLKNYVSKSMKESKDSRREYSLFGHVYVYVQDFLPDSVDIVEVLEEIENRIPAHLSNEIDTIFIGDYDYFDQLSVTAMYDSGAIYVSNKQTDSSDMIDDIVHEIAHSLEQPYGYHLYSDEVLETEFIQKRSAGFQALHAHGYATKKQKEMFQYIDYSSTFDAYLYKEVGYDRLVHLFMGIFTTPYAATSLREYFATGFEDYFLNDREYLKKVSPKLFNKIHRLTKGDYDE